MATLPRIPLFVGWAISVGKLTPIVSPSLLQVSQRRRDSPPSGTPSCIFAYVGAASPPDTTWVDSSVSSFECHLCNSNLALANSSVAEFLISMASSTVCPPLIRSSTYRPFSISATLVGSISLWLPRCCWITPPSRNGDGPNPNNALVKRNVSTRLDFRSSSQWKRKASLSSSLILTCRNAFFRSPAIATA